MDDGVKQLYYMVLKNGWTPVSSGYKVYENGRRLFVRLSHPDFKQQNFIEIGPIQKTHWRSTNIFEGIEEP